MVFKVGDIVKINPKVLDKPWITTCKFTKDTLLQCYEVIFQDDEKQLWARDLNTQNISPSGEIWQLSVITRDDDFSNEFILYNPIGPVYEDVVNGI